MEAPEPEIEPETPPPATLQSLDDHSLDEVTRKINVTAHYRLGVALGRRGVMQDALSRLGSKPYRTLGAVMSAASKFRGSLKEKYTVDHTEEEEGGGIRRGEVRGRGLGEEGVNVVMLRLPAIHVVNIHMCHSAP